MGLAFLKHNSLISLFVLALLLPVFIKDFLALVAFVISGRVVVVVGLPATTIFAAVFLGVTLWDLGCLYFALLSLYPLRKVSNTLLVLLGPVSIDQESLSIRGQAERSLIMVEGTFEFRVNGIIVFLAWNLMSDEMFPKLFVLVPCGSCLSQHLP